MARYRAIYGESGKIYEEIDGVVVLDERAPVNEAGYYVASEEKLYAPYKSMQTGEMIEGRKRHREHLKAHGLIEVGNEQPKRPKPLEAMPGLKQELIRHFYK